MILVAYLFRMLLLDSSEWLMKPCVDRLDNWLKQEATTQETICLIFSVVQVVSMPVL